MTYQIIYSSAASTPMEQDELDGLLEHAQAGNDQKGITGALVYVDGFFLQILEGERESVLRLMKRISGDLRHETVTVLQEGDVSSAAFSDWKMAFVSATPQQVAEWAGLSGHTKLPDVLRDMRKDRQMASDVAKRILAVLLAAQQANG